MDISTNSRSRIFFTTFCGRDAAGLNGLLARRGLGVKLVGLGYEAADAAAANMSSPDVGGVIMGSLVIGLSVCGPARSRGGW